MQCNAREGLGTPESLSVSPTTSIRALSSAVQYCKSYNQKQHHATPHIGHTNICEIFYHFVFSSKHTVCSSSHWLCPKLSPFWYDCLPNVAISWVMWYTVTMTVKQSFRIPLCFLVLHVSFPLLNVTMLFSSYSLCSHLLILILSSLSLPLSPSPLPLLLIVKLPPIFVLTRLCMNENLSHVNFNRDAKIKD